ncbi:MAG: four helix bundle protein [Deltaproteobacteria bacterium]|nr:four helix bundle protein [Deltaproteobacteria bacterium]
MLRVYWVSLEVVAELRPVIARIERHDRDLARQTKKASTSVPLNIAEGSFAHGGHRRERYQTACSSMRETMACCHAAEAAGYEPRVAEGTYAKMREVIGTLVNNLKR